MAFMMSPILSLAVGGLKGKDMTQAVGLANMIRQLGGAIGIALLNVYLINSNAQIRSSMLGYINIYDTVSADRISLLTQNFKCRKKFRGSSIPRIQSIRRCPV